MSKRKPSTSRLVKVGWAMLAVVLGLYAVSVATGPHEVWNFIPPMQVEFELLGRPWCMHHRIPVPMYEGIMREVASDKLGGVYASLSSPWTCPVCGQNWADSDELWMWIRGLDCYGKPLGSKTEPRITIKEVRP